MFNLLKGFIISLRIYCKCCSSIAFYNGEGRYIAGAIGNIYHIPKIYSPLFICHLTIDIYLNITSNAFIYFKKSSSFRGIINSVSYLRYNLTPLIIFSFDKFTPPNIF